MAHLSNLPAELLSEIILLSSAADKKKTLKALSLVSRSFHNFTAPFLYHTFESWANQVKSNIQPFARTIIEQPGLRRHVKRLVLSKWLLKPHVRFSIECAEKAVINVGNRDYADWILSVDPSYRAYADWYVSLYPSHNSNVPNDHFFVAILFIYLLHLEEIQLGWPGMRIPLTVRDFFHLFTGEFDPVKPHLSPRTLQSLSTLRLCCPNDRVRAKEIVVFMRIPSLEKFEITFDRCSWKAKKSILKICRPGTSTVTAISIEDTSVVPSAMQNIIKLCKIIKSFNYSVTRRYSRDIGLTASEAVQALRHQKSALRELTLDFDEGWERFRGRHPQITACSLQDFENLTMLEIGQESLLGLKFLELRSPPDQIRDPKLIDVLPPALKSLSLLYCDMRIEPHLLELAAVRRDRFPSLEKICIGLTIQDVDRGMLVCAFPDIQIIFRRNDMYPSQRF